MTDNIVNGYIEPSIDEHKDINTEFNSDIYSEEYTQNIVNRVYESLKMYLVGDLHDFIEFDVVTVVKSMLVMDQPKIELQQHIFFPELQHYIYHFGELSFAEFALGSDILIE